MHIMNETGLVFHKVRVRYHKNKLKSGGLYVLKTVCDRTLCDEDIVKAMKTRGGYTGSYEDALEIIRR